MRLCLVGVSVMAISATAGAQPAEGERRFTLAQGHYAAGRYDVALTELQAAQVADPQPEYLWAIAQAYRLKGDCSKAVPAYGDYLRTGPPPAATRATQLLIDECAAKLATADTAPLPPPPRVPAEPLVIREVKRVHTREITLPWHRDSWGNALLGAGVGCFVVGAIGFGVAGGHDSSATETSSYQRFDDEIRARDRAKVIGVIALSAGGALVVGGLLHYALRPKRIKTEVLVEPGGAGATIGVSWSVP